MDILGAIGGLQSAVAIGLIALQLGVKVWALVDSLRHRPESYAAAGKWQKNIWVAILAVTLAVQVVILDPVGILNIVGLIAAGVYLADVRPAVRQASGQGGAGRSGGGPYGGW